MPNIPAITPTNLKNKPATELPEFEVHITLDHTIRVRAIDEDSAIEETWGQIMDSGDWGLDITELEDEDGAS